MAWPPPHAGCPWDDTARECYDRIIRPYINQLKTAKLRELNDQITLWPRQAKQHSHRPPAATR
jgi:hypothetical protein